MSEKNDSYIVLGEKGGLGLTVTNYVYKPGRIFSRDEWKWGDKALEKAIENGRCKPYKPVELVESEKAEPVKVAKSEKAEPDKSVKSESPLAPSDKGRNK